VRSLRHVQLADLSEMFFYLVSNKNATIHLVHPRMSAMELVCFPEACVKNSFGWKRSECN
jgi:hypothetical protein